MSIEDYQNVVLGAGEAGKYIAWSLAKQGQRTVVVERSMIGGSCPNVACLPSKNVVHSAKVFSLAGRGGDFGISTGSLRLDMAGVTRRKRAMVDDLIAMNRQRFAESGAELLMGEGRFTGPRTIDVATNAGATRTLRGQRVFLAVGTRASLPTVPGLRESAPMTHVEALELERLPAHLVILGGGYVGLEFAQAMRRFGSDVTIVHRGARLLDREDPDVSEALLQLMRDAGTNVLLRTEVRQVTGRSGSRVQLQVQGDGHAKLIDATDLLVATGRTPNTDRFDAVKGGIELDARGYIRVDETLRASAPDVWALGDCAGSPHFTHVAFDDHRIVRDNLAGGTRTTRDRLVPYCLFVDPELAHVGLGEAEATARGIPYRVAKLPMAAILRTWTLSEKRGFLKALIGDDDRILGFTALGVEAGELVAVVQTAMLGGMPYTTLREAVYTHPTIAEGLGPLFSSVPARAAHVASVVAAG